MRRVIGRTKDGLPIYLIEGGSTGAPPAPATEPPAPPASPPADPPAPEPKDDPRFTQADVTRIAAREKAEGERAALAKLATDLGVTIDEAKEIVKAHNDRAEADKTEAQRAKEAADREKAAAETERAAAAAERHAAKLERALMRANAPAERLEKLTRLVDAKVGDDDEAIETAVKATAEEFPELFAEAAPPGTAPRPKPPAGDPPGKPPRPAPPGDRMAAGRERAKQMAGRRSYSFDPSARKEDTI